MHRFAWIASQQWLAASVDLPPGSPPPDGWPTVVVVHGLTGHRLGPSSLFVDLGRALAPLGMACVRFDQAGAGESTGDSTRLTVQTMAADTAAVLEWARRQPDLDGGRHGYVGRSLGALAAVAAEARCPATALSLWAPIYDLSRVFSRLAKTGLRAVLAEQGWVPFGGTRLGAAFVDDLDAIDTATALTQSGSPLLVFHSHVDEKVRFEESASYRDRCREIGRPCELVELTNADHAFTTYTDRRRVVDTTVAFFRHHLVDR